MLLIIAIYLGIGALFAIITFNSFDFLVERVEKKSLPLHLHEEAVEVLEGLRADYEEKGQFRVNAAIIIKNLILWPFLVLTFILSMFTAAR